jgi:hypothetical protein
MASSVQTGGIVMLLSSERAIFARFILCSDEDRAKILAAARADMKTSGPLIQALEWASKY